MSQTIDPGRVFQVSLTLAQWNTHLTLLSLIPALIDGQLRQMQTQLTAQLGAQPMEPPPGLVARHPGDGAEPAREAMRSADG